MASLTELRPSPQAETIAALERLLADAREGSLRGLVSVARYHGRVDTEATGEMHRGDLALAALEIQQSAVGE